MYDSQDRPAWVDSAGSEASTQSDHSSRRCQCSECSISGGHSGNWFCSTASVNVGQRINTPNQTLHVRLVATADCWVAFGASPAALGSAPSSIFLPAGVVEYFWVFPGEQVAVIQNAGAGLLNVAEMLA